MHCVHRNAKSLLSGVSGVAFRSSQFASATSRTIDRSGSLTDQLQWGGRLIFGRKGRAHLDELRLRCLHLSHQLHLLGQQLWWLLPLRRLLGVWAVQRLTAILNGWDGLGLVGLVKLRLSSLIELLMGGFVQLIATAKRVSSALTTSEHIDDGGRETGGVMGFRWIYFWGTMMGTESTSADTTPVCWGVTPICARWLTSLDEAAAEIESDARTSGFHFSCRTRQQSNLYYQPRRYSP